MNTPYKTEISDLRWMAYDIPGNAGWIAYLICALRGLREKRDAYNIASALPGALMLIGVGELISERFAGLSRPGSFREKTVLWIRGLDSRGTSGNPDGDPRA